MFTKKKIFHILAFLLIITSILLVVARNMPSPFGSFRWLYSPLWLLAVAFFKPRVYIQKPVLILLIYGLISIVLLENMLWSYMSDWYHWMILEEFYALIVTVTLMSYFITSREYKAWAVLSELALIFIVITGIMTVIATSAFPEIVRYATAGFDYSGLPQLKYFFDRIGCGGYGFGQSLILLFPVLVYFIKFKLQTVFSRPILIFILIFLFFVLLRMQFFANIITASVVITISFLGVKRIKSSIAIVFIVIIFALLIPLQFYTDILKSVAQLFDTGSENYYKFNDMASFIVNPEINISTAAGSRIERYPMLIKAFLMNPLFGDASYNSSYYYEIGVGQHLFLMSRLTVWGVFGFSFYAFMLRTIFKSVISLFDKQFLFYYALSIISFIIMGLMKTIAGRENWIMLFVIIPGLYYLPLIGKNKKAIH